MFLLRVEVLARLWNLAIVNLFEPVEYCTRCGSCQLLENYRADQRFVVIVVQLKLVRSEAADDLCEDGVVFLKVFIPLSPHLFLGQACLYQFLSQSSLPSSFE